MSAIRQLLSIFAFYAVLSYIVFPLGFYYLVERSLLSAGNGFVVGSIVSVGLWYGVGRSLVK